MKNLKNTSTKYSDAYLRWKRQLIALKHNDLYTVKKLAQEARDHIALQKKGRVQLSFN